MNIKHNPRQSEYGPGVDVRLTSEELAFAIMRYLVDQGVNVYGPRTITLNGQLCRDVRTRIYVDPSGYVVDKDGKTFSGRGIEDQTVDVTEMVSTHKQGDE